MNKYAAATLLALLVIAVGGLFYGPLTLGAKLHSTPNS